jgi:predicted transcriptional regulator
VPGPIREVIRSQIAKGSPEVPVWLDFGNTMKTSFGLTAGEPNVVVFDAAGRLRMKINGTLDQAAMDRLVNAVQRLRYEAAK